MTETEPEEPPWETPSLDWIHRVRRESREGSAGRPPEILSREEAEKLAARFGLELGPRRETGR